jgi:Response regulator containing CheY-like receiver domain and AraC-type DNA-binding domain
MLKLLVVDDEVIAIDGIKSAIRWDDLGIEFFSAYNIRQAKEIFMKTNIDIMLCDIEMPQGNGLELLAWVRENSPQTQSFILTCHADFNYAKQAIKFGSLDYILKPISYSELESIIVKTKEKILKSITFLNRNMTMFYERLWNDIINNSISLSDDLIKQTAVEFNIPISDNSTVLPILVSFHKFDKKNLCGTIKDKITEHILAYFSGECIALSSDNYICIIRDKNMGQPQIREKCNLLVSDCYKELNCELSCYIGREVTVGGLKQEVDSLFDMESDNVLHTNKVFFSGTKNSVENITITLPDMNVWSVMLLNKETEKVLKSIQNYFIEQVESAKVNAKLLNCFKEDYMQMIYYILKENGIQAHLIPDDINAKSYFNRANRSVNDMMSWVKYITIKSVNYIDEIQGSQTIIDKVVQFIKLHISEDITRDQLANYVYLNPDYLTRIFKKQTGKSISTFILDERMKIAGQLLASTSISVSLIANQTGYTNFSYFAKVFKRYTGYNPVKYRDCNRSNVQ